MCGQYFFEDDPGFEELHALMDGLRQRLSGSPAWNQMASGRVSPTDIAPVLIKGGAALMRWGFHLPDGRVLINARSETAARKALFSGVLEHGRCAVPAAFFYEWQHWGRERVRYACCMPDGKPMALAALYRIEPDQPLPVFVVLTRPAQHAMASIHDRMPVLLDAEGLHDWLSGAPAAPLLNIDAPALVLRAI